METNKPIDWSKPIQDHTGRIYTILTTERPYKYAPIVAMCDDGLIVLADLDGIARTVSTIHKCPESSVGSLVLRNAPPKPVRRSGWINVYPWSGDDAQRKIWLNKCDADTAAREDRIDCVKVEWEEIESDQDDEGAARHSSPPADRNGGDGAGED